jgi:hypothetical protein
MKYSRWLFRILLIVYVLSTLLLHKRGNDLAGSFVITYGGARYREGVRVLSIAVGAIILPFLIRNLWQDRVRLKYLAALMPLALLIDQTMMSVPLERIHYVQYGALTWLCYGAFGQPFAAALMAFLIGYIDEAHQFWVLYAGDPIQYFDWNDISLNLLGVLGTLFLFLPRQPVRPLAIKRLVTAVAIWVIGVVLLVGYYRPDRYLFRDDPYKDSTSFWIAATDRSYHVMNASQGMIFLGVVWIAVGSFYMPPLRGFGSCEPLNKEVNPNFSRISSTVRPKVSSLGGSDPNRSS